MGKGHLWLEMPEVSTAMGDSQNGSPVYDEEDPNLTWMKTRRSPILENLHISAIPQKYQVESPTCLAKLDCLHKGLWQLYANKYSSFPSQCIAGAAILQCIPNIPSANHNLWPKTAKALVLIQAQLP